MAIYISPDITTGTYVRARLVVEYSANASSNNNTVKAYVQMWRTNTGFTTSGSGTLYIGVDGYGWASSAITSSQVITYNSYTQVGSTRSLTISMDSTGRWTGNFHVYATSSVTDNIAFSQQTFSVTLEPCPVYSLSISAGTGSSITANRTSSPKGSTGNLSAGTKKLYYGDKLKITFTPSTNYSITTHTVNGSAFTSGGTHTVSGNVDIKATATPLKSLVAATDANIGSTSSIIITRYNNSYTHTLTYNFGGLTGTIREKTTETTIPWTVPDTFYAKIPDDPSGICTITCTTYNGNTSLGSTPCTMTATAAKNLCSPDVNVEAADSNEATIALTGNNKKIIRYHSDLKVCATSTEKNGATIKQTRVYNGTRWFGRPSNYFEYTFENAEIAAPSAYVEDSRGYSTTKQVEGLSLIPYIKLTANAEAKRTSPTSDTVTVSVKGNYYNGNFGVVNNTLRLQVRYKPKSKESYDETDAWMEMSVTLDGDTYTAEATLTGLDYTQFYDIRVRASDQIYKDNGPLADAVCHDISLNKGIPVFDWGENDFRFNVPISIQSQPVADFIIKQGTSGIWTYEKWASGTVKMWGMATATYVSNYILEQQGILFPFEFIEDAIGWPGINEYSVGANDLHKNAKILCKNNRCSVMVHNAAGSFTSASQINVALFVIGKCK